MSEERVWDAALDERGVTARPANWRWRAGLAATIIQNEIEEVTAAMDAAGDDEEAARLKARWEELEALFAEIVSETVRLDRPGGTG